MYILILRICESATFSGQSDLPHKVQLGMWPGENPKYPVALTESQESSYKGVGRAKRRDDASQLVVKVQEAVGVKLGIWQKQTEIFPGASKRYTILVLAWEDKFCRKFLIFFSPTTEAWDRPVVLPFLLLWSWMPAEISIQHLNLWKPKIFVFYSPVTVKIKYLVLCVSRDTLRQPGNATFTTLSCC